MSLTTDTDPLADPALAVMRRTIMYSNDLAQSTQAILSRLAELGLPITWVTPGPHVTFDFAIGQMLMSVDCLLNGLLSFENCVENLEQCADSGGAWTPWSVYLNPLNCNQRGN